jgi:hypothetical protein
MLTFTPDEDKWSALHSNCFNPEKEASPPFTGLIAGHDNE